MLRVVTVFALVLLVGATVAAVDVGKATYVDGSGTSIKKNTEGALSTNDPDVVVFGVENSEPLRIPYSSIASLEIGQPRVRWPYRVSGYFFRITYRDAAGKERIAVFEMAADVANAIVGTIQERSGKAIRQFNR